jgi:purine-nucleoside phosphorylase
MSAATSIATLDPAVRAALGALSAAPRPRALYLLATGVGLFAERLDAAHHLPLGDVDGIPTPWRDALLHAGRLDGVPVWLLDDEGAHASPGPPWHAGFPCWLAAAAGARVLVHASAGVALASSDQRGTLAALRDHIRFGDANPLLGLGESELGPLFPDVSALHDASLRALALERGKALGVEVREAVAVCTRGPSLDTPAERALFAHIGGEVLVQNLAAPLLAAAHAGLSVLALVAVTDAGTGPVSVEDVVSISEALAPALDDLLADLAPAIGERANALRKELGA